MPWNDKKLGTVLVEICPDMKFDENESTDQWTFIFMFLPKEEILNPSIVSFKT